MAHQQDLGRARRGAEPVLTELSSLDGIDHSGTLPRRHRGRPDQGL